MDREIVKRLKEAYAKAYKEGDALPAVERRILIASIASSARTVSDRLTLLGVDQAAIKESLVPLVEAATRQDTIGKSLGWMRGELQKIGSNAVQGVLTAFLTAGIGGVIALGVAMVAKFSDTLKEVAAAVTLAGQGLGGFAAFAVAALPTVALVQLFRFLAMSVQNADVSSTNPVSRLWEGANGLGRGADAILSTTIKPMELQVFSSAQAPSALIPERLRSTAKILVVVGLIAGVTALILFASGVIDGYTEARAHPRASV
jgi:hypothetical protein